MNFSVDSKILLLSLCENILSPYAQRFDLTGLKCYLVLVFRKSRQGNHTFDHQMHGNAARSVQYPKFRR